MYALPVFVNREQFLPNVDEAQPQRMLVKEKLFGKQPQITKLEMKSK
jgi:hypothetical protein